MHPGAPGGGPPGVQFNYHGHQFNRFHAPHAFVYPPGWSYRRWGIGGILPPIFLTPDYYFMDWAALGVPPPPPGDQWVRYGPDLLLVDVSTGQVVDAIYDAFY
ncbi:MAG: RcnB family protein [Xanthobacteraceae bacterium]